MLDIPPPAFTNLVLATLLLSLLALAHLFAHKRNMLQHHDMQNRLHVAWTIALIGLPAVLYPKSLGLVLWACIPVLAWQEWVLQAHLSEHRRTRIWWLGVGVYAVQLSVVLYASQDQNGWISAIIPSTCIGLALARRVVSRWVSVGIATTLLLPAFAIPMLMHARLSVLVWCFVIPQLFDALQYIVGRKWGKTSLSRWSPKKTWEGLLGGALLAWCAAMALSAWLPWPPLQTAKMTVLLLVASYFGGLASSVLKRQLGLKDWSTRLGSHGGVLDRMDSLVFSIPIAWAFYTGICTTKAKKPRPSPSSRRMHTLKNRPFDIQPHFRHIGAIPTKGSNSQAARRQHRASNPSAPTSGHPME